MHPFWKFHDATVGQTTVHRDARAESMGWTVLLLAVNARVTDALILPRLTWMQIWMLTDGLGILG